MNSNETILKLQKTSRIVAVVLNVLRILLALAVLGVILGSLFYGASLTDKLSWLFENISQVPWTATTFLILVFCAVVKLALFFAILTIAFRIFRDFSRQDSPFRHVQVQRMKRIALLIFIASFINLFSIQLVSWLAALLIWCVAKIFDYGCQLQQESDETL